MREFLSIEDQRSVIPIYDNEPIEEGAVADGDTTTRENRMDLGGTEKETAKISDLDLLKVIGKGSFGKVSGWGGRIKGQIIVALISCCLPSGSNKVRFILNLVSNCSCCG